MASRIFVFEYHHTFCDTYSFRFSGGYSMHHPDIRIELNYLFRDTKQEIAFDPVTQTMHIYIHTQWVCHDHRRFTPDIPPFFPCALPYKGRRCLPHPNPCTHDGTIKSVCSPDPRPLPCLSPILLHNVFPSSHEGRSSYDLGATADVEGPDTLA